MEDEERGRARAPATNTTAGQDISGPSTGVLPVSGSLNQARTGPEAGADRIGTEGGQYLPQQLPTSLPSMDMSSISGALPGYGYQSPQNQPFYSSQLPQMGPDVGMMYHYHPSQFQNPSPSGYAMPYAQQLPLQPYQGQRMYGAYPISQHVQSHSSSYLGPMYYPGVVGQNSLHPHFQQFQPSSVQPAVSNISYGARGVGQYPKLHTYSEPTAIAQSHQQIDILGLRKSGSNSSLTVPTTIRGPPRKPKQSGHALWVGNLPPGTNIVDLKDHFSKDATDDIESVFLISKSNCAFVNYKTEQSCGAAMNRFHDSRFLGVRLVCRLRRGSAPGVSPVTPIPAGSSSSTTVSSQLTGQPSLVQGQISGAETKTDGAEESNPEQKVKEKYFIIKSLTVEDLERSVHTGIWATQSHNETTLNKAYHAAENVYLIFSANKSGEYFGYARMDSAIDDESISNIDTTLTEVSQPVQTSTSNTGDTPVTIMTAATATAPRGHIIDDSARGTIFWEAECAYRDEESDNNTNTDDASPAGEDLEDASADEKARSPSESPSKLSTSQSTTFGKPFKITWMSTTHLPFYRTRGLRNPWNTNREVKIARDGTELEPITGRKLVGMFGTNPSGSGGRAQGHPGMNAGQQHIPRPYH